MINSKNVAKVYKGEIIIPKHNAKEISQAYLDYINGLEGDTDVDSSSSSSS